MVKRPMVGIVINSII